jgi:prevent-host-death family protein
MRTVSLAEAKAHLSKLLDSVAAGEEITITRHGRAVAKVSAAEQPRQALPLQRLAELRGKVPARQESSSQLLRKLRDEE